MATTKIGQVSILPCGAFSLGTHYERLSVVTYNGSSYIAKVENTNKPITDTTVWYLLASKGDKGDTYEVTPEDLQAIADQITSDASSAFNVHVTEKTTEFDNHVTSKTGDFDTNASNKTTTFNNNATSKTGDFNTNATSKTTDFNTNASNKTTAYDNNASAKVEYYNQNAEATIEGNVMNLDQIPKKLVEGTTISVNDSSNLPLANIQIKGNASQTTTSIAGGDEYDSPTPDHPQPISVVTGDNTVKVVGKNFLNYSTFILNQVPSTSTGNMVNFSGGASSPFIKIDNTKHYTYSANITGNATGYIFYYGLNNAFIGTKFLNSTAMANGYDISTYENYSTALSIKIRLDVYSLVESNQLELGSTATAYEPYTEQSQLISLGNIELAKIGNYEDYIYKENGKWYKYGAVGKKIFDGTENIGKSSSTVADIFSFAMAGETGQGTTETICNYLIYKPTNIIGSCRKFNNFIYLIPSEYGTYSVDQFKTLLAQKFNSENPYTVYYILGTPTITEITDTTLIGQLDSLLALKTNRNTTNAFTVTDNETPTLAVLYRQDLTTLFNNLTSAILSLGNNT